MSASTQAGETTRTLPTNGNGHRAIRKARGPNKPKTGAKAAAPQGVAGAAQTAEPVAVTTRSVAPAIAAIAGGSIPIAYVRQRIATLDAERGALQSLIAAAAPRTAMPGAPRKAKQKRAKRKSPMKQAA